VKEKFMKGSAIAETHREKQKFMKGFGIAENPS
jgi:hypothetical protein